MVVVNITVDKLSINVYSVVINYLIIIVDNINICKFINT